MYEGTTLYYLNLLKNGQGPEQESKQVVQNPPPVSVVVAAGFFFRWLRLSVLHYFEQLTLQYIYK